MNKSMARRRQLRCRDEEEACGKQPVRPERVVADEARRARAVDAKSPPVDDASRKAGAVVPMTKVVELPAAMRVPAWPGPPPAYRAESREVDPAFAAPVTASTEEILQARRLRLQLEKKYLNRPIQPCSLWCVGVD